MHKSDNKPQSFFLDFNHLMELHMNPENRRIRMADMIPWDAFEEKYKHLLKARQGTLQSLCTWSHKALKKQPPYVRRDIGYLEDFMSGCMYFSHACFK